LELENRQRAGKKTKNFKYTIGSIFKKSYQKWYSEAYQVIKQILSDRLSEFEILYKGEGKRKAIDNFTYTIQDWLLGVRSGTHEVTGKKYFDDFMITVMRFNTQLELLKSAEARFESSLFDIKQVLQADLFDSELEAASVLNEQGFYRGAGSMAGVVLEKHLDQVRINHKIKETKKSSSIGDLNNLLKKSGVLEIPEWRFIQRLGDLRNLCTHKKEREPSQEEVAELINGVGKILKKEQFS